MFSRAAYGDMGVMYSRLGKAAKGYDFISNSGATENVVCLCLFVYLFVHLCLFVYLIVCLSD
jgi:hypothetical protein